MVSDSNSSAKSRRDASGITPEEVEGTTKEPLKAEYA